MTAESPRYTAVAITLHWIIATAITGMIFAGWYMGDLPNGAPGKEQLYQLHKSMGITILTLTVARILWRIMNPPPPLPAGIPPLERAASHAVHLGFYALMILLPLTGWLYVSTAYEFQVPTVLFGVVSWPHLPFVEGLKTETAHGAIEFVHSKLAWVVLALLALHIAGGIKHDMADEPSEQGVFKRMIPGLMGSTTGPFRPGRGLAVAFGAAAAAFTLVAVLPLAARGATGGAAQAANLEAANWTIDYDASEIRFSGVHDGKDFSGVFGAWTASIAFDAANLAASQASVAVETGSARTGTKLYDDSLRAAEWFGVSNFPTATVEVSNFRRDGEGYAADAALTIKDTTLAKALSFDLEIDGSRALMRGSTSVTRTEFDLGQQSDPGADWVGEDVQITILVEATRTE